MRVIHVVPSAFNYFDDIRAAAFVLVDGLYEIGINAEVLTVQYGAVNKKMQDQIKKESSSAHTYQGSVGAYDFVQSLDEFDLVHVHCPLLGAAAKILAWKKNNPRKQLVVTYYRDVFFSDAFSVFVALYNRWYLPKLCAVADAVICNNVEELAGNPGFRRLSKNIAITDLSQVVLDTKTIALSPKAQFAAKVFLVYNNLIH